MKTKIQVFAIYSSLLCTIMMFNSCTTESVETYRTETSTQEAVIDPSLTEINVNGTILYVEEMENGDYLFGDMIFPRSQFSTDNLSEGLSAKTQAVGRIGNRWPNNTVPYFIEEGDRSNLIEIAIAHMQLFTNLTFYETTIEEDPYALGFYDTQEGPCSASVGYQDISAHSNFINAGPCLSVHSIIHEIGHVLGLWHEQSSADRNNHIIVNFENTLDDAQFVIYGGTSDGFEYTDFDFDSVMLYDSYASSSNGRPVMTKLDGTTFDGSTTGRLSDLDIEGLQQMYPSTNTKLFSIIGGNGLYVSSENGKNPITCNRTAVGRWEKFIVTPVSPSTVVIQDNKNKKYLTYNETDGTFIFNGTSIDAAVSLSIRDDIFGQSDYFYGDWNHSLTIKDNAGYVLTIDEDNDEIIKINARGGVDEFKIQLIN